MQRRARGASSCEEPNSVSPRMLAGLLDDASAADVCVNLCRRYIGVTEHRLDGAQVGAALDEVSRERVTQLVRRDVAGREPHAGAACVVAQRLPESLPRHRPTALGEEQRTLGGVADK